MSFIDDLSACFVDQIIPIEMPESAKVWGWPEKVYATPFTMGDRKKVQRFIDSDQSEAYLRVVCMKLCDADGKRLLEDADKFRLAKVVPAWVIAHVGDQILASQSSEEDEEKK